MPYSPSLHTATNKPIGLSGKPLDARSYYYDDVNFVYRPYLNVAEVLAYLDTAVKRVGQFPIIINTGGTLSVGVITGGTNLEYWFKDGVSDAGLVEKASASSFEDLDGDPMDNPALAEDLTRIEGKADDAQTALDLKVDKVTGKGLSTEDYTTTEKTKLAGIEAGATANSSDSSLLASAADAAASADAIVLSTAQTYADGLVVGLLDDRGNYDASVNTFPASGGSGSAGSILKGDIWIISVAGTLGGSAVAIGDQVRALVNTPGQTSSNWAISEANIGYVPENVTNKSTSTSLGTSNTLYPTQNAVKTYIDDVAATKEATITAGSTGQYYRGDKSFQTLNKNAVGLSNVDNTSDANKAVSTAQAAAIAAVSIVGQQDLFIPAAAIWPRATGACADLAKTEIATSLVNMQTLDFDQSVQEYAQFSISLPRNWNNGTVLAKAYWTAAVGTGDVVWSISGGAYSNDDALSVALGTAQSVTDSLITANDVHISPTTSAITLAGSPQDADLLFFQITRVSGDAADTLSADAKLMGIVLTITLDAGAAS